MIQPHDSDVLQLHELGPELYSDRIQTRQFYREERNWYIADDAPVEERKLDYTELRHWRFWLTDKNVLQNDDVHTVMFHPRCRDLETLQRRHCQYKRRNKRKNQDDEHESDENEREDEEQSDTSESEGGLRGA